MPHDRAWTSERALSACPTVHWQGSIWRTHRRSFQALDSGGTRLYSGRYHRSLSDFPPDDAWEALYLSLAPEIYLGEILRHLTPSRLSQLNDYRITEVAVTLQLVLDSRDPLAKGLRPEDVWHDTDFSTTQALAGAARSIGVEGMLVSSATRLGDNLIVFPDLLRNDSRLVVLGSRDPRLFVPRE